MPAKLACKINAIAKSRMIQRIQIGQSGGQTACNSGAELSPICDISSHSNHFL
jgi:hypothetical protein